MNPRAQELTAQAILLSSSHPAYNDDQKISSTTNLTKAIQTAEDLIDDAWQSDMDRCEHLKLEHLPSWLFQWAGIDPAWLCFDCSATCRERDEDGPLYSFGDWPNHCEYCNNHYRRTGPAPWQHDLHLAVIRVGYTTVVFSICDSCMPDKEES